MFEKLPDLVKRCELLTARIESPEVYSDTALFMKYEKEIRELKPVVDAYAQYLRCGEQIDELRELAGDQEYAEIVLEETAAVRERQEQLASSIRRMLLPKDPNDSKNVIIEIRAGVGGEESALFAADLFRMYSMYSDRKGWKTEVANIYETQLGGFKEISFIIQGEGAYSRLKFEAGGHRVQRVPVTESGGRIHTSAATVAVLPEISPVEFTLNPNDLKIDTYRSSGAGGQHVNKTESAIRITHIPTGVVVECQDERSQYKNKDRAMQILRSKLYEAEVRAKNEKIDSERRSQVGSGDRSDRVRTYNFPQNRVTDHRLSGDRKNFNIDQIINGDLDQIIDSLLMQSESERLKEQSSEL